jgi:hypothetical protein
MAMDTNICGYYNAKVLYPLVYKVDGFPRKINKIVIIGKIIEQVEILIT